MKIDFYISSLSGGGAEKVLITIAEMLSKNSKHQVTITSLEKRPQFYSIDETKVKVNRYKNKNKGIVSFIYDLSSVRKQMNRNRADIIISFLSRCNLLILLGSLLNRQKIIVCDRNNPLKEHSRAVFLLSCLLYVRATAIVVQTNEIKKFYPRFFRNKIIVIENPIDNYKLEKECCRNGYSTNRVISMGRLEPQKDFETLINAFAKVSKQYSNWNLDIYGTGEKETELQELIDKLEMNSKIKLCGRTDKPVYEMSKSDIFVLSSFYEGFPNVLCEAMYAGCACVSTDCVSGPKELIQQDYNGKLVPINDVVCMESALVNYISNKELRYMNGTNAQKTVERLYVDRILCKWEDVIYQIGKEK